jgi:hypothetical protein
MFTILSHKGNANQNIEILPHPHQSGYHPGNKKIHTDENVRKRDPYSLLLGM